MKKAILFVLVLMGAVSFASASDYGNLLPHSNEVGSASATAAAAIPAAVAVSSLTPTRIDAAVNAALLVALGAQYKRGELQVQTLDPALVNCGYSAAVTTGTAGGFRFTVAVNPITFNIGRSIGVWCQGIASTATFIVGGLGYK
jgi:hypothetical protein